MPAQLTSTRSCPCASRALAKPGVDARVVGDVDRAEQAADLACQRLAGFGVEVEQRDLDAFGGERAGGGGAEAGCTAGHHRGHGTVELHVISFARRRAAELIDRLMTAAGTVNAPLLPARAFATARSDQKRARQGVLSRAM